ncbi:MAG: beta-propeller fold lactonase family protein [Kofleriaceae bacterium]
MRVILPPRVYLENNVDGADTFNSITTLSYDEATGALTEAATLPPVSTGVPSMSYGGCAQNLTIHEATRRLFVSGTTGIAVFSIDPITGTLMPIPGSPFAHGNTGGWGIDINAAGTRLWFSGYTVGISAFDIADDGTLTQVSGSPFPVTPRTVVLTASSDGGHVYALAQSGATGTDFGVIHTFSVAGNGALAIVGVPVEAGNGPFSMTRRPNTDQLYVADRVSLQVYQPGADGVPAQIKGSPFALTTMAIPHVVAFTPDGSRAYLGIRNGSEIQGFTVEVSGAVTAMPTSPFRFDDTLFNPTCMSVSRDGRHLISNNEGGKEIAVLSLAADGVPTHVAGSPFTLTPDENASGLAITF